MRRATLALLLVLIAIPLHAGRRRAVTAGAPPELPNVDSIAAAALADGIPSVTIAVRRGPSLFLRSYGVFDVATALPARPETVYQIASVSKQFTAAAILRLAEEGRLSLDDRAGLYLPELDQRFDAITIRHLLNHTSGLHEYLGDLENAFEPLTEQQVVAMITKTGPTFTPGSRHEYNNSGYFLLGMIIERLSARSYEQYLRQEFFEPLGLESTSYCGTHQPAPGGTILLLGQVIPVPPVDMSLVGAAGALCSTAENLIRWNLALASGRAVRPESYQQMIGSTVPITPLLRYGYGLVVDQRGGRQRIWHNGSILGFQSMLLWDPQRELTIAVLVNMTDLDRDRAGEIAFAVAAAIEP